MCERGGDECVRAAGGGCDEDAREDGTDERMRECGEDEPVRDESGGDDPVVEYSSGDDERGDECKRSGSWCGGENCTSGYGAECDASTSAYRELSGGGVLAEKSCGC